MAGTEKSVNITIALDDFYTLKDNEFSLCFAKKVGNIFNVVWQSYHDYLRNNIFHWTPVYQLFGTNTFEADVKVRTATDPVNIGLGEQATLDGAGVLGPASTGGKSTGITMVNDYGPIHPGLFQKSTGIMGKKEITPIYVAENQIVKGSVLLTPIETVMVWFEQNIETSTMFSDARSNSVVIDLTKENSQTRQYKDGKWTTPNKNDLALAVIPILTIIVYVTGAVIAYDLASKIASKLTGVYKDITVEVTTGENNKVTVTYHERQDLTPPEQRFLATLMTSPVTDVLMEFTVDSLAQSGVGYTSMEAYT